MHSTHPQLEKLSFDERVLMQPLFEDSEDNESIINGGAELVMSEHDTREEQEKKSEGEEEGRKEEEEKGEEDEIEITVIRCGNSEPGYDKLLA